MPTILVESESRTRTQSTLVESDSHMRTQRSKFLQSVFFASDVSVSPVVNLIEEPGAEMFFRLLKLGHHVLCKATKSGYWSITDSIVRSDQHTRKEGGEHTSSASRSVLSSLRRFVTSTRASPSKHGRAVPAPPEKELISSI